MRDRSQRAYDGAAESTSPALPMTCTTRDGSTEPSSWVSTAGPVAAWLLAMVSLRQQSRSKGISERAYMSSAAGVSAASSGRPARQRSASIRSSSSSGNVVVVSAHWVRAAMRSLSASLTSSGRSSWGGESLLKNAASMAFQPIPARIPTTRTLDWLMYRWP